MWASRSNNLKMRKLIFRIKVKLTLSKYSQSGKFSYCWWKYALIEMQLNSALRNCLRKLISRRWLKIQIKMQLLTAFTFWLRLSSFIFLLMKPLFLRLCCQCESKKRKIMIRSHCCIKIWWSSILNAIRFSWRKLQWIGLQRKSLFESLFNKDTNNQKAKRLKFIIYSAITPSFAARNSQTQGKFVFEQSMSLIYIDTQ